MVEPRPTLGAICLGELVGTFLLVLVGCGMVHTAVTTGSVAGIGQVAIVWGVAVTLAIYCTAGLSGAHINPAITFAMALWTPLGWSRVLPYVASQLAGAALAAAVLLLCFGGTIEAFEAEQGIRRGAPGSEVTASMYGEYFPNPAVAIHGWRPADERGDTPLPARLEASRGNVSVGTAVLIEVVATFFLALCVFVLTDAGNPAAPHANTAPLFIGSAVAVMVALFGPMTQACMNPARDFGPRFIAWLGGWGPIAFPGPRGAVATLLVYLAAPLAGGALGGLLYVRGLRPRQLR